MAIVFSEMFVLPDLPLPPHDVSAVVCKLWIHGLSGGRSSKRLRMKYTAIFAPLLLKKMRVSSAEPSLLALLLINIDSCIFSVKE